MTIRFIFDVKSQSLHGEGFAYGYVVVEENEETKELTILDKGECYSLLGAKEATDKVKENVIPSLIQLTPYLEKDLSALNPSSLPEEIVMFTKDLRDKFYKVYSEWKKQGAEFWSDVNFPVKTNFLSAVVKDGNGDRDWEMPYPLKDVANSIEVNVDRNAYSGLPGLRQHNPLDDALASAFSLYNHGLNNEQDLKTKENDTVPSTPKKTIRVYFDVEAEALHDKGFAYGYVAVEENEETKEITILEQGECYSILGAKEATDWVKKNVIPSLTQLTPYLEKDLSVLDPSSLPKEIVMTTQDLRDKFYNEVYRKWKKQGAEFWSDVNFPVETNFLSDIVKDRNGSRDEEMSNPLKDVSHFIGVDVDRNDYSELPELRKHNPLDDSLASAFSLYKHGLNNEQYLKAKEQYLKAKEQYLKAKEINLQTNDSVQISTSIQNMGSPVFTKYIQDRITNPKIENMELELYRI